MRNLVGSRITLQDTVWRTATSYTFGGSTYQSVVQRLIGPGDIWESGKACQHAHRSAETALECGETRLSRKADRWLLAR